MFLLQAFHRQSSQQFPAAVPSCLDASLLPLPALCSLVLHPHSIVHPPIPKLGYLSNTTPIILSSEHPPTHKEEIFKLACAA